MNKPPSRYAARFVSYAINYHYNWVQVKEKAASPCQRIPLHPMVLPCRRDVAADCICAMLKKEIGARHRGGLPAASDWQGGAVGWGGSFDGEMMLFFLTCRGIYTRV